ncbi:MAG TPA: L,D-transpeptidase [Patescibacteria group bacterium]|nr:L,D-transpeptidase [Patescibacteria group bacterium]
MPKKGKRNPSKTAKKRGVFFFITRYFLFFSVALLFFAGTTAYFKWNNVQPTCANSTSCTSDLTEHIDNGLAGIFEGKTVIPPTIDTTQPIAYQPVLGATTGGEKHIYVDLAKQTLYAYQGATLFMKTLVSTGKWGKTPVGNFHIWEKLVATRMSGGEGADAYDLPNVPWVMYFYHDFGLHGAYWHDNFGHTMSHGCVNMRQVDAQTLFQWADGPQGGNLGTQVSICTEITGQNQCVQDNPVN